MPAKQPEAVDFERIAQDIDRTTGMLGAIAAFVACTPGAETVTLEAAKKAAKGMVGIVKVSGISGSATPLQRAERVLEPMIRVSAARGRESGS